jgi:hypothetical protein
VVEGEVPAFVALEVIAGLPLGSRTVSMMAAAKHGGTWDEWYGKDRQWFLVADLIDAVRENTHASGNWGKVPEPPKPYPRPGQRVGRPKTVKDLYRIMMRKYGGVTA